MKAFHLDTRMLLVKQEVATLSTPLASVSQPECGWDLYPFRGTPETLHSGMHLQERFVKVNDTQAQCHRSTPRNGYFTAIDDALATQGS
jgi:hypothetical protein